MFFRNKKANAGMIKEFPKGKYKLYASLEFILKKILEYLIVRTYRASQIAIFINLRSISASQGVV
jgi:hypothetical protein